MGTGADLIRKESRKAGSLDAAAVAALRSASLEALKGQCAPLEQQQRRKSGALPLAQQVRGAPQQLGWPSLRGATLTVSSWAREGAGSSCRQRSVLVYIVGSAQPLWVD